MISSILAEDVAERDETRDITPGGAGSISAACVADIQGAIHPLARLPVSISISGKEWRFPPEIQVDHGLVDAAGGAQLLARLLIRRGIKTASDVRAYLDPSSYSPTGPMELPDMPRAIVRISKAIAQGEHITVYGDYDVDGVTATSVVLSVLKRMGADVDYYIPHRTSEGYGLNLKAVSVLASKRRTRLIISCDCGISNFAEINFARSLGVDTVIVDHHSMPELLPPAAAILHPKQLPEDHPLYNLPGVGVAYKLCQALLEDRGQPEEADSLLDLVTLGMIADMVPLVAENRYLVQVGMPRLVATARPGLKALLSQVRATTGTDLVGFGLAPRINAVGRLADANLAVELMTTEDDERAGVIARQLESDNIRRQELCEKILAEAEQMVLRERDPEADRAIVIYQEGWHHGVVGIVASRLVEKFHRAVFIGELDRQEGVLKGSARGVEGLDLYEVLKANEHLMTRWGGHKMAAGFSLEADKAEPFRLAITDTCNRMLADCKLVPVLELDAAVEPEEVSLALARLLQKMAPFGMGNRKPVLVMKDISVASTRLLGKEGKHSRIMLEPEGGAEQFECVLWNSRGRVPEDGAVLDVAFMPEVNEFRGQERLQLVLSDWRLAGGRDLPPDRAQGKRPGATEGPPEQATVRAGTARPLAGVQAAERRPTLAATRQVWKDVRRHDNHAAIIQSAVRNLGDGLAVFAEGSIKLPGVTLVDRSNPGEHPHLLIWQFPPDLSILTSLVRQPGRRTIYLAGVAGFETGDVPAFLKRLFGLARFAVSQREGRVRADRLAAAMGATAIAVALGLGILRKLSMLDWFAEDGVLHLDILDYPSGRAEDLPEYRQLSRALDEMSQFRKWCADSPINEIQLAVAPDHVRLSPVAEPERRQDDANRSEQRDDRSAAALSTPSADSK